MQLNSKELERIAFIQGNSLASLYASADDAENTGDAINDALIHIKESKGSMPNEDFLQHLINQCRAMCKARITKSELSAFCDELEELQSKILNDSDYGLDELRKAEKILKEVTA